jgi:hypothetical protein
VLSYKRAFGAIRSSIPDGQAIFDQSHTLQMFLANPVHPKQLIFFNLRSELKKIDGHEDVLAEMLGQCTDFLERGIFVTPDDKYYRCLVFLCVGRGRSCRPSFFHLFVRVATPTF